VPLHVPPLRDRVDDVPALVEHFLTHSAQRLHRDPPRLATDALDMLCQYHWPGNVRELENLITRATVLAGCDTIDAAQLRPWLIDADGHHAAEAGATIKAGLSLQDMERQLIEATLDHFGGHRAHAAQALGIGVRTLSNKLRSYGYAPRTKAFAKAA